MNIDGMTQLEIEEEFDDSNMKTMLTAEFEIFFNKVEDKHIDLMAKCIRSDNEDYNTDIFIYILSVIGNNKVGSRIGINSKGEEVSISSRSCINITNKRDIGVYNLIQAIAKAPVMNKISDNPIERYNIAMDIVAEFDGVLYDMHQKTIRIDDGQFATVTYARSEITFSEESSLRAQYNRFRLPMIEKPDDWTTTQSGGYKLNKNKVTTNKGEGNQPQQCLDVLNKLQEQPYRLTNANAHDEELYTVEKLRPKSLSFVEAEEKARIICLTSADTYEALQDREFYFEWKFDFRGRMYSTGYDINLQANKYKKGAIQPC